MSNKNETTMLILKRSVLWICLCLPVLLQSQNDPVLFSVEGIPVHLSEFEYIYNKNNGAKADYSRASLEEYLDLYTKFKLKVNRAKELKLDTIPSLKRELEGYRRQLANSYLTDKEVSERLARELYERKEYDVDVSHILISLDKNPNPADTTEALAKAMSVKDFLAKGQSFEGLASKHSEDKNSRNKGGRIGFVSAMLPNGFYALENAIYTSPEGQVVGPVRTAIGYHLVKVNGKRKARGKIEGAHILIRKKSKGKPDAVAKSKIDSVHLLLNSGANFNDLARNISEDKSSKDKGGNIGIFGINRFEKSFEDAAFALNEVGEYTKPVETTIGWHIIKLLDKKDLGSFDRQKRRLQADIAKDGRYELAQNSMIDRIKSENGFRLDQNTLNRFADGLNDDFLTYKWKVPKDLKKEKLFTLGKSSYHTTEFAKFLRTNSRSRLRMNKNLPIREVVGTLHDEFVRNECIKFEEANLEKKYPDFRSLMREYEEGILLFEATKIAVWDKASKDTVGLKKYYEANKNDFMWAERAEVANISVTGLDESKATKIHKGASKCSMEKLIKKYNKSNNLKVDYNKFEKDDAASLEGLAFDKGSVSPLEKNADGGYTFKKVVDILPKSTKQMNEARGYIIADYQDYLEKIWVNDLKKAYSVDLNKDIFEGLIK